MIRRLRLGLVGLIVVAFAAVTIYVGSRQHLRFNPPDPEWDP